MLKKSASGVLETREASFVSGFGRFTLHVSRTTRTAFLSILRGCSSLVPDVQAIEVLPCRNGFSAACYTSLIRKRAGRREGFPGRMGKSPDNRRPEHERFHTVPWPWNGPALYVTEHWTGKRWYGRKTKGIGASQGGLL